MKISSAARGTRRSVPDWREVRREGCHWCDENCSRNCAAAIRQAGAPGCGLRRPRSGGVTRNVTGPKRRLPRRGYGVLVGVVFGGGIDALPPTTCRSPVSGVRTSIASSNFDVMNWVAGLRGHAGLIFHKVFATDGMAVWNWDFALNDISSSAICSSYGSYSFSCSLLLLLWRDNGFQHLLITLICCQDFSINP